MSNRQRLQSRPRLDLAITVVGLAATLVPYFLSDRLIRHPRMPTRRKVNALDRPFARFTSKRASYLSAVPMIAAIAGSAAKVLRDSPGRHASATRLLVLGEALAVDGALNSAAKFLTQRPLPLAYGGRAPRLQLGSGGYRGFYSGHVSVPATALAFVLFPSARRGLRAHPWWWTGAGLALAGVAAGRVLAGRHFPSDTAVGALAGAATGAAVRALHVD